ncbi:hypothetical protein [Photobacterium nomapromontoriensis]|uniref:hypothetical protein n=1 Tax=Photobacterium nomapromontoriensis TaxID=2910237 RepID=UPI003D11B4EA
MNVKHSTLALAITALLAGCGAEDNNQLDTNIKNLPIVSGMETPPLYAGMPVDGVGTYYDPNPQQRPDGGSVYLWRNDQGQELGNNRKFIPSFDALDQQQKIQFCMIPVALEDGKQVIGREACGDLASVQEPLMTPPEVEQISVIDPVTGEPMLGVAVEVGDQLKANSTYTAGVEVDETKVLYSWRASKTAGYTTAPLGTVLENENEPVLTLKAAETEGNFIQSCVTPVTAELQHGRAACSDAIGPIAAKVGSAPVAADITLGGHSIVGASLVGRYTYTDKDGDQQSGTTIEWLRGATVVHTETVSGETSRHSYTPVPDDIGQTLSFCVTPRSATGLPKEGVQSCVDSDVIVENSATPPTADKVSISAQGIATPGKIITGNYTYAQTDSPMVGEGESLVEWRMGNNDKPLKACSVYEADCTDYSLTSAELHQTDGVTFCIQPVTETGKPAVDFSCSEPVIVSGVKLSGKLEYNQTLTTERFGAFAGLTNAQMSWRVDTTVAGVSVDGETRNDVATGESYTIGTNSSNITTDNDWYALAGTAPATDARHFVGKQIEFCAKPDGSDIYCVNAATEQGVNGGLDISSTVRAIEPVRTITFNGSDATVEYHRPLTAYEYSTLTGKNGSGTYISNGIEWQLVTSDKSSPVVESVALCQALGATWGVPGNYFGSGYEANTFAGKGNPDVNSKNTTLSSFRVAMFGTDTAELVESSPVFGWPYGTNDQAYVSASEQTKSKKLHIAKFHYTLDEKGKAKSAVIAQTVPSMVMCASLK